MKLNEIRESWVDWFEQRAIVTGLKNGLEVHLDIEEFRERVIDAVTDDLTIEINGGNSVLRIPKMELLESLVLNKCQINSFDAFPEEADVVALMDCRVNDVGALIDWVKNSSVELVKWSFVDGTVGHPLPMDTVLELLNDQDHEFSYVVRNDSAALYIDGGNGVYTVQQRETGANLLLKKEIFRDVFDLQEWLVENVDLSMFGEK